MAKTIKMTIPLKGISKGERKTTFEADGFAGVECRTATEAFERALGSTEHEEIKAEMYDVEERHEFLRESGDGDGPSST